MDETIQVDSKIQKIKAFFSSYKNISSIVTILIITLALPVTMIAINQRQTTKQQAAEIDSTNTVNSIAVNLFYVSPTGSDSNPGTLTLPWKTIYKAAQTLKAGETAIFEDGIYYENRLTRFTNEGTATAPITLKARNKQKAVIFYKDYDTETNPKFYNILLLNKSYITIQDFEITKDVIRTNPNNNNSPWDDELIRCDGSNYCRIIGNKMHYATNCFKATNKSNYAYVEGNICYDSQLAYESLNGSNTVIKNNEYYGPKLNGYNIGVLVKGGDRTPQVYNNYIHVSTITSAAIYLGGVSNALYVYDPSGYEAYNAVAWNNIIISETPGAIESGIVMQGCSKCAAFNNVVIGANTAFKTVKEEGIQNGWTWNPLVKDPQFKNNIVTDCVKTAATFQDIQGTIINDYNLYHNCPSSPKEAHGVYADPRFVDKTSNWHLQLESPAINKGIITSFIGFSGEVINVAYDKDGIRRNRMYDIGAYEYTGSLVSPTQIIPTPTGILKPTPCSSRGCTTATSNPTPTSTFIIRR